MSDEVTDHRRGGEVAEWNTPRDYLYSLPLSDVIDQRDRDISPAVAPRQTISSDVEDEEKRFSDWFAARQLLPLPKFNDESRLLRATRRGSVDGPFARPQYYSGIADSQRGWSGRVRRLSDTASGWKRSTTSDAIVLDAALSRLEEQIARKRLLEQWLKEVYMNR